jgi:hypothetical protein
MVLRLHTPNIRPLVANEAVAIGHPYAGQASTIEDVRLTHNTVYEEYIGR